jgi:outer membrane protein assembly factor BamA
VQQRIKLTLVYLKQIGLSFLFVSGWIFSFSQSTIRLDVQIRDVSKESVQDLSRKLSIPDTLVVEFSRLQSIIDPMIGFLENQGYPFAKVRIDSLSAYPLVVTGVLSIVPGEYITFDTIMNRTGFRISQLVLYRLINIRPGDPYQELALSEATYRIGLLPYIKQSRSLEVGFHSESASVYLYPQKSGANRFDGWLGLSPDLRLEGKLSFSGLFALNLTNLIAQGEEWQLGWRRSQDGSQKLNIAAQVPYLAGLPIGFGGKFELVRQDTSYLNLDWALSIPYQFNSRHRLNAFIRHKESSIFVPSTNLSGSVRQPFESFLSGIGWDLNKLDNPLNPYKGFEIRTEASIGSKNINSGLSLNQSEFSLNGSLFLPISKAVTFAAIFQSGFRKSEEVLENEQYRLGGLFNLRGFDEDAFYSNAYSIATVEFRYLLDATSHLLILSDFGLLQVLENRTMVTKKPLGIGIGGQIRTNGGIFRVIYALGKYDDLPFNLKNSKIHLGYVGVF